MLLQLHIIVVENGEAAIASMHFNHGRFDRGWLGPLQLVKRDVFDVGVAARRVGVVVERGGTLPLILHFLALLDSRLDDTSIAISLLLGL